MSELEIKQHIQTAISQLSFIQQKKLLDFIQSMLGLNQKKSPKNLLAFVGIFDKKDSDDFRDALQIDHDGWS